VSRPAGDLNRRFDQKYRVDPETDCFIWMGRVQNMGYPCFDPYDKPVLAHRWAYERQFGSIPAGLTLDHLCRTPRCVNPAHLEAVTQRINVLRGRSPAARNKRKTHCIHGHPFSMENTYVRAIRGTRRCRICTIQSNRESLFRHGHLRSLPGTDIGDRLQSVSPRKATGWHEHPLVCCNGHLLAEVGIYLRPDGYLRCRACTRQHSAEWRKRHQALIGGAV